VLKVLKPEVTADGAALRALKDEFALLRSIQHDHLVRLEKLSKLPDGRTYLATEYLEGETLAVVLARGPLDPARMFKLARPIGEALDFIHSKGVLHQAIRPSNVFLAGGITAFAPKLIDLDLGLPRDPERGTPYRAPELITGGAPSPRSDLYAFAALIYEGLIGHPPPPAGEPLGLPEEYEELIDCFAKAFHKDPWQRYRSAVELVVAFADAKGVTLSRPMPPQGFFTEAPQISNGVLMLLSDIDEEELDRRQDLESEIAAMADPGRAALGPSTEVSSDNPFAGPPPVSEDASPAEEPQSIVADEAPDEDPSTLATVRGSLAAVTAPQAEAPATLAAEPPVAGPSKRDLRLQLPLGEDSSELDTNSWDGAMLSGKRRTPVPIDEEDPATLETYRGPPISIVRPQRPLSEEDPAALATLRGIPAEAPHLHAVAEPPLPREPSHHDQLLTSLLSTPPVDEGALISAELSEATPGPPVAVNAPGAPAPSENVARVVVLPTSVAPPPGALSPEARTPTTMITAPDAAELAHLAPAPTEDEPPTPAVPPPATQRVQVQRFPPRKKFQGPPTEEISPVPALSSREALTPAIVPPPPPAQAISRRPKWLIPAVAVAAVGLIAGALAALGPGRKAPPPPPVVQATPAAVEVHTSEEPFADPTAPEELLAPLEAEPVQMEVVSSPPGASVIRLDTGEVLGLTPLVKELPREDGTVMLRIELAGYKPSDKIAMLSANTSLDVTLVRTPTKSPPRKPQQQQQQQQRPATGVNKDEGKDGTMDPYAQ
jgi:serine/threonine protein kinase